MNFIQNAKGNAKNMIQSLLPVHLLNCTEKLYIAVLGEDGKTIFVLSPGQRTSTRVRGGIDGFAAYEEEKGIMRLIDVYDTSGVRSDTWKLGNRIGLNCVNTVQGDGARNPYRIDRPGIPWQRLNGNEKDYFRGLRRYANMPKSQMLSCRVPPRNG